jgi:hypothetical protein
MSPALSPASSNLSLSAIAYHQYLSQGPTIGLYTSSAAGLHCSVSRGATSFSSQQGSLAPKTNDSLP